MALHGVRDPQRAELGTITFQLLFEEQVSSLEQALVGALLIAGFGWRHRPKALAAALRRRTEVRERGYTLHRPAYRVLAWADDQLVGGRMVCRPTCDPPGLRLYDFGDAVVHPEWRRRGIAQTMTRLALDEAERQHPDVMLTSTAKLEPVYREYGFRPALALGEVRLDCHGRLALLPTWLIRWRVEPAPILLRRILITARRRARHPRRLEAVGFQARLADRLFSRLAVVI